ncbi:MAG: hypothetical protein QM758_15930 [Armatimonas sp.]
MRRWMLVVPLIALAGCGGNGNDGGGGGGGELPTFTRSFLNGSFGESGVVAGKGGQAAGASRPAGAASSTVPPFVRQATMWALSSSAPTVLHPSSRASSELFGLSDALFVGWTTDSSGTVRAAIWDRTAGNAFSELSGGFTESRAYGVASNLIAGQGRPSGGTMHAVLWNKSAGGAPTDLNGSFTSSSAFGIGGTRVVGFGATGGVDRATLWDTAAGNAVTDLHPSGASSSQARGISGDIVAGSANGHAGFWNLASGDTFTDLTPSGSGTAYGTNGRFIVGATGGRVGFTSLSGELFNASKAALWDRENSNALVDLHTQYLNDQGYQWSVALGVDEDGNVYGVGGAVVDDYNANYRAWVLTKR